MTRIGLALLCGGVLLAACGDDEDGESSTVDAATADAPSGADAPPDPPPDANPDANLTGPVREVECIGIPVLTIKAAGSYEYTPPGSRDTVPVGSMVRFEMPDPHNATSGANRTSDGKFRVGFKETKCFNFTVAGAYPFFCEAHNPYNGSITVIAP